MFSEEETEQQQIREWYQYQQQCIASKLQELNTDNMDEMRKKLKRKQTKNENEKNLERLEQERLKIIQRMGEHTAECEHPHCREVEEIIMCYDLINVGACGVQDLKKDNIVLIVKYSSTGYKPTDCPVGSIINKKMIETHRILKEM